MIINFYKLINSLILYYKAITCKANQVFETRAECAKTCLYPNGNYNCGVVKPFEWCYCSSGFVEGSNNKCILSSKCGCSLPDKSGVIQVIIFYLNL